MSEKNEQIARLLNREWPAAEEASAKDALEASNFLLEATRKLFQELTGSEIQESQVGDYAERLGYALLIHVERERKTDMPLLEAVAEQCRRVEGGLLSYGQVQGNLARDAVLAEALVKHNEAAAELFEEEYMPMVRAVARRAGGESAVAAVENLCAYLIMPRNDKPPRIASYRGKTLLRSWLRVVTLNLWYSECRKAMSHPCQSLSDSQMELAAAESVLDSDCEALLETPLRRAVDSLDRSDRVLLRMVVLDGTPQNELAVQLRVPKWKITRRKQRAIAQLLDEIKVTVSSSESPSAFEDCLQQVLGGDSPALRSRIGEILAASISAGTDGGD